jgi:hypothetical protein
MESLRRVEASRWASGCKLGTTAGIRPGSGVRCGACADAKPTETRRMAAAIQNSFPHTFFNRIKEIVIVDNQERKPIGMRQASSVAFHIFG